MLLIQQDALVTQQAEFMEFNRNCFSTHEKLKFSKISTSLILVRRDSHMERRKMEWPPHNPNFLSILIANSNPKISLKSFM